MQKTLAEKGAETGAQEAELAQLTREIEAAKETVARQPYNPTDVKRMHAEREELERELHRLKEQKERPRHMSAPSAPLGAS